MSNNCPDHFSHRFKLNIDKLPTKAVDCFSRSILLTALICGLLLCFLGLYHFLSPEIAGIADIEKNLPRTHIKVHTLVSPLVFNALLLLIGCGIIAAVLFKLTCYKIIFFDGDNIHVKKHYFFEPDITFSEPLYNYTGVRLRVKFYQFGIFNKNKFIVELYHKDPQKTIPLYISTSKRHLRRIWKTYAQELKMPAITISEKSMVSRNFNDLNKPYAEVISDWHLPKNFAFAQEKPDYITFKSRKTGEKMIKIRKTFFDAYGFLSVFAIVVFGSLLIYAGFNHRVIEMHVSGGLLLLLYALPLSIVLYCLLNLIIKDIIILTLDRIIVFRKIWFLKIRDGAIPFKDLKSLDINYTPTSGRYFLAMISDKDTIFVGNKLPVEGLRWIRAVIINEIIGN